MTLLSIAIYSDCVCGILLSGKREKLTLTNIFTAGSIEELFEKNERLQKNGITKTCLTFSDHYVNYFFSNFKGAKENELEKIIGFRVKDFIPYPTDESIIGNQVISAGKDGEISLFSTVIEKNLVKKHETALYSRNINNFSCTSFSFPFLNFTDTDDFALCAGFRDCSTIYFVHGGKLVYSRKLKLNAKNELSRTLDFYGSKYSKDQVSTLFTTGNVDTSGLDLNLTIKNIDLMDRIKTAQGLELTRELRDLILPALGAALCV